MAFNRIGVMDAAHVLFRIVVDIAVNHIPSRDRDRRNARPANRRARFDVLVG